MKKLTELILERYVTLFYDKTEDKDKMMEISKEVYRMIVKSYEYIGGLAGCSSYKDFVRDYIEDDSDKQIWKYVRRGDHITAIKIYSTKRGGRKGIVMATDGTEQGKNDINKILEEDYKLKERGAWDEVSGKALGAALNKGAIPLPNSMILDLMKDKDKTMFRMRDDGWFYDRRIAGDWHTKLLIGYPPKNAIGYQVSQDLVKKLKDLGKEYEAERK